MALVPELLRALVGLAALYSTNAAILLSPLREIVFGALIIAFLIFEPHGLAEIWRRVRRYSLPVAVPNTERRSIRQANQECDHREEPMI